MKNDTHITIGRLGTFHFKKGYYVYVGSAKRNIEARIQRHLKIDKKTHWHLDYLRPYLEIQSVATFPGSEGECSLFDRLCHTHSGEIPAKGFGSSDCRCISHLFYSEKKIII